MLILNDKRETTIRHWWLYAIALQQGKYYVGITAWSDPYIRLKQHGTPAGARWTKKYKPLKPIVPLALEDLGRITQLDAEKREQEKFEELAKQYGLQNVRGGHVTYTGRVFKLGSHFLWGEAIWGLAAGLLLMVCGVYILLHR